MTESLTTAVERIAGAAGWRMPVPDDAGIHHFLLEDGLDLDVGSPDGRWCVLSCDLGAAPDAATPSGADELARLGARAAATARAHGSVLSIADGRLELFMRVPLDDAGVDVVEAARRFLNDEAQWREFLGAAPAQTASPFSFGSAGWFPGEFRL